MSPIMSKRSKDTQRFYFIVNTISNENKSTEMFEDNEINKTNKIMIENAHEWKRKRIRRDERRK